MSSKLLVTFLPPQEVKARAVQEFGAVVAERTLTVEEILSRVEKEDFAGILIVGQQKFSAEVIQKLPSSVKIIATCSVGFDHIDLAAAQSRKIVITNTPDVLSDCTADLNFLLMLNVLRRSREGLQLMQQGWGHVLGPSEMLGQRPSGRTVGILGMGRIGREFADRCRAFRMKIVYCNRRRLPPELEKGATYYSDFHSMLPHCQVLSLNAPASPTTDGIMDEKAFSLLPRGAVFVNTSRGKLVNEDALIQALKSGHLFGAGLDVFWNEPDYNRQFADFPNVFVLPHVGSATLETRNDMGDRALDNIAAIFAGHPAKDSLRPH